MKRSEYMAGYEAGYMNGQHNPDDVAEEAIRADERAKCRAELRANVDEVKRIARDGKWVDQVWVYKSPVEDIVGDSIREVIERANDECGCD